MVYRHFSCLLSKGKYCKALLTECFDWFYFEKTITKTQASRLGSSDWCSGLSRLRSMHSGSQQLAGLIAK